MHRSLERNESVVNLPPPTVDSWGWQVYARCRDHDPTAFFEADDACEVVRDGGVHVPPSHGQSGSGGHELAVPDQSVLGTVRSKDAASCVAEAASNGRWS